MVYLLMMYDRFGNGEGIVYRKEDSKHFVVIVEIETSPQFYGWLCSFGNKVKIMNPKSVKDEFSNYLQTILGLYYR